MDQAGIDPFRWEAWQAWSEWLERYPWEWFCTFTERPGTARGTILAHHRQWRADMHRRCGRQLRELVSIEHHRDGREHLHTLGYGAGREIERRAAEWAWRRITGALIVSVREYQQAGGAAAYVAKAARYVAKESELRLLGPWRAQ